MYLTDQFGSQQLIEFDSYCDIDCNDPSCKEVEDGDGNPFGRRRVSLFIEGFADLSITLRAGSSTGGDVKLANVIGILADSDFSEVPQETNFVDTVSGVIVPPDITLVPEDFRIDIAKNYSLGAIVIGSLPDDDQALCNDVAFTNLFCTKVETLDNTCADTGSVVENKTEKAGDVLNSTDEWKIASPICVKRGESCDVDGDCCSENCRMSTCHSAYRGRTPRDSLKATWRTP